MWEQALRYKRYKKMHTSPRKKIGENTARRIFIYIYIILLYIYR